ncbi:MAG: hypothetical protein RR053_04570 [Evtepia sp.]
MLNGQTEESKNIVGPIESDLWSNAACCGYAMFACQNLNYSQNEVQRFIQVLELAFGTYSVGTAEKKYYGV